MSEFRPLLEPHLLNPEGDGKELIPDAVVPIGGSLLATDVAITHSTAPSYQAFRGPEGPIAVRERLKLRHYRPVDRFAHMIPFVLSSHGAFGKQAQLLVSRLVDEQHVQAGQVRVTRFDVIRRISVAVQSGQACMMQLATRTFLLKSAGRVQPLRRRRWVWRVRMG